MAVSPDGSEVLEFADATTRSPPEVISPGAAHAAVSPVEAAPVTADITAASVATMDEYLRFIVLQSSCSDRKIHTNSDTADCHEIRIAHANPISRAITAEATSRTAPEIRR
ncbi:hypothetical protein ABZV91_17010 [Nocardia sp. NPDC004568]|uniref:hypothetical protein n=1 Tax=Nocardia sp. NPDC004568 TaxID=3154551 RepID=UPI0033A0F82C